MTHLQEKLPLILYMDSPSTLAVWPNYLGKNSLARVVLTGLMHRQTMYFFLTTASLVGDACSYAYNDLAVIKKTHNNYRQRNNACLLLFPYFDNWNFNGKIFLLVYRRNPEKWSPKNGISSLSRNVSYITANWQ